MCEGIIELANNAYEKKDVLSMAPVTGRCPWPLSQADTEPNHNIYPVDLWVTIHSTLLTKQFRGVLKARGSATKSYGKQLTYEAVSDYLFKSSLQAYLYKSVSDCHSWEDRYAQ